MYRSHDAFTEDDDGILNAVPGSNYASQKMVFDDLGQGVLDNAFQGLYITIQFSVFGCIAAMLILVSSLENHVSRKLSY